MTDSDPDGDPGTADAETTFYQYDLFGNLLRVDLPDGRAIEYDVDGAGRRVGRRELDQNGDEISFRGWIYRDLLRPIAEVDAQGNVVARYVYGDAAGIVRNAVEGLSARLGLGNGFSAIHGSGRLAPRYIEELGATGAIERTIVPIGDELGTVVLLVEAMTGEVLQRLEYGAFGEVLESSGSTRHPFAYGGGFRDAETAYTKFGARDLDHEVGRWLARDPIRFKSGVNMFIHASSDPLNALDPTGLATYRCERPLGDYNNTSTDDNRRNGPDVAGNPLYHEYICVSQGDHMICNGLGPNGATRDVFSPYRCDEIREDDPCLESCIAGELSGLGTSGRTNYDILGDPFGAPNCKDYARSTVSDCDSACAGL